MMRARERAARRLSARRSSSLMPPQTPASCPVSRAHCRQRSTTSQRRQTALASSICRSAGPVFPIGKNSSGSSSRQAARWRQSIKVSLLVSCVSASADHAGFCSFLLCEHFHDHQHEDRPSAWSREVYMTCDRLGIAPSAGTHECSASLQARCFQVLPQYTRPFLWYGAKKSMSGTSQRRATGVPPGWSTPGGLPDWTGLHRRGGGHPHVSGGAGGAMIN